MSIFQTGTGYRDASKALTIKALQERQKAAADAAAQATQIQTPIADPLQGFAHLSGILSSGMQESRAAQQEGAARQQLAGIMAKIDPNTGPTQAQLAEMQMLDPDFANKQYEAAMAERRAVAAREDEQAFRAGESQVERDARIAEQNRLFAHQDTSQEDQQAAASDLSRQGAEQDITKMTKTDELADQNVIDKNALDVAEKKRQEKAAVAEAKRKEGLPQVEQAQVIDAYNKGQFGEVGTPEAIAQRDAALEKLNATTVKPGDAFTPGQQEVDKKFAPEVLDWKTSGGANATKAITQVNKAIDLLQTKGPTGLIAGIADQTLPEWASKYANPDAAIARDAIRETVQQTLRATLGSQFTEKEGADLMNRAFDINLLPAENIRRARLLLEQVSTIAQQKQMMVDHFDKFGTISNYTGPPVDLSALINLKFDGEDTGGAGTGAGTGGATNVDDLLEKYK